MQDLRSVLGNKANEQAAVEQGADFTELNRSQLPPAGDEIEVVVESQADGIAIRPRADAPAGRGLGEFQEGPREILRAQMMEEPDTTALEVNGIQVLARAERVAEVAKRPPREMLIWYGAHPDYYMGMTGDRILVRRDTLELEDACKFCHGLGYLEKWECTVCRGEQVVIAQNGEVRACQACVVLGYDREQRYSSGHVPCASCKGSGWRAGVIIPEVAETKPITGIVVSLGPDCKLLKLGDRIIHSRFAGHELTVSKTESFVMMREPEVLSILRSRHAG